ncbi:MAG: ATP-binding protein [Bryobacteraceae bacterium]
MTGGGFHGLRSPHKNGLRIKPARGGLGELLGDAAAVTAMLDRILHHGHVLKCGPRSWRTKTASAITGDNQ